MDTKICIKCCVEQSIEKFPWTNKEKTKRNNTCNFCLKEYISAWYQKNSAEQKIKRVIYYQNHKDDIRTRQNIWRENHKEEKRISDAIYRHKNPEKTCLNKRIYR